MLAVQILLGAKQIMDASDHKLASCKHVGFSSYHVRLTALICKCKETKYAHKNIVTNMQASFYANF